MRTSITIAIPLFNEEDGIENLYKQLDDEIENLKQLGEIKILLIDDGSTDKTSDLLKQFFYSDDYKIITHTKNLNLGGFFKTAIGNCQTDYIAFLDSDCTYSPKLIAEMYELTKEGYEIINASPWHPKGRVVGLSTFRILVSKIANLMYRLIVGKKIYTSSSICKIYKNEIIKNIKIENKGFVSVTELYTKALLKDFNFYEFPCTLTVRKFGTSKIKILPTAVEHIKYMIYLLINKRNIYK